MLTNKGDSIDELFKLTNMGLTKVAFAHEARPILQAIMLEVIGQDKDTLRIDPITSPLSLGARTSQNQLKAEQRKRLEELL